MLTLVKLAVLGGVVVVTNQGFAERVLLLAGQQRWFTLSAFVAVWAMALVAILIGAFQRRWLPRLVWALVVGASTSAGYSYYLASGAQVTLFDALSLWGAIHEAGAAYDQYRRAIVLAWLAGAIAFVGMALPYAASRGWRTRVNSWLWWAPAVPIVVIVAIILQRAGGGTQALPVQFVPAAIAAVVAANELRGPLPPRRAVTEVPAASPAARHVLMLVDESIRPDYLDFTPGNRLTPNLPRLRERIADFGAAVSAGNCSHYANAILRLGGTREDLVRSVTTSPSIWQYARRAGFRTVYVDAQSRRSKNPGRLQNFMALEEVSYIDELHVLSHDHAAQLDFELLRLLGETLRAGEPTFVYANKNGAHFPFDESYPSAQAEFLPTHTELSGTSREHEGLLNSYRNGVRWSVDGFFAELFERFALDDVAIIYTSDHGQRFEPGRLTHCSVRGAHPLEGIVPLWLIAGDPDLAGQFAAAARRNRDRADHFAIFPTLLGLFGYDPAFVRERYGEDLFAPLAREAAFSSGDVFGLFSDEVNWTEVRERRRYLAGAPAD